MLKLTDGYTKWYSVSGIMSLFWQPEGAVTTVLSMTKRSDYALLALSHLAISAVQSPLKLINTKEIAEQFEIPTELLAKILQVLAKHGIVASHPGPTGGYRLLRNPSEISVSEVMTIVDGPPSLLHCSNGQESECRQYDRCTIRSPLGEIESRVKALLETISLEDISGTAISPKFLDFSEREFAAGIQLG